jgi:hypothetical protein
MQINLQESGTFLFISDHCHVIENVRTHEMKWDSRADNLIPSGETASRKAGWQEITQLGSAPRKG